MLRMLVHISLQMFQSVTDLEPTADRHRPGILRAYYPFFINLKTNFDDSWIVHSHIQPMISGHTHMHTHKCIVHGLSQTALTKTRYYLLLTLKTLTENVSRVRSNYFLKPDKVSFQAKFCPSFEALPSRKLGKFFKF